MDNKKTIKVGFDYKNSGIDALDTWLGVVIWCTWRENHVVNQYFNDEVLNIVEHIERNNPKTEEEFVNVFNSMQSSCGLEHTSIKVHALRGYCPDAEVDKANMEFDTFLRNAYRYWKKECELIIKEVT